MYKDMYPFRLKMDFSIWQRKIYMEIYSALVIFKIIFNY